MSWAYDSIRKCYVFREGGIVKAQTGWQAYLNPKNWGVSRQYEKDENGNMRTFNQAYGAAREAGEKEFMWNNNRYNTDFKLVESPSVSQDDYSSLRYSYLEALENPGREGFDEKTQRWTPPTRKGFDPNQIGIGLDMNTNAKVKEFLRKNGRTKNPWLSHQEMIKLLNDTLLDLENILDKNTKGIKLSNTKRAIAIGLLYHGLGPKLWNPNGPKTQRLNRALFNGSDQDFIDAVTDLYNGMYTQRSVSHSNFWKGR